MLCGDGLCFLLIPKHFRLSRQLPTNVCFQIVSGSTHTPAAATPAWPAWPVPLTAAAEGRVEPGGTIRLKAVHNKSVGRGWQTRPTLPLQKLASPPDSASEHMRPCPSRQASFCFRASSVVLKASAILRSASCSAKLFQTSINLMLSLKCTCNLARCAGYIPLPHPLPLQLAAVPSRLSLEHACQKKDHNPDSDFHSDMSPRLKHSAPRPHLHLLSLRFQLCLCLMELVLKGELSLARLSCPEKTQKVRRASPYRFKASMAAR